MCDIIQVSIVSIATLPNLKCEDNFSLMHETQRTNLFIHGVFLHKVGQGIIFNARKRSLGQSNILQACVCPQEFNAC